MNNKKRVIIIFLIVVFIISVSLIINKFSTTGKSIGTTIEVVPLSSEEIAKVKTILECLLFYLKRALKI